MAATIIHGYKGYVHWSAAQVTDVLTNWDLTIIADIADSTGLSGSNAAKSKTPGLFDWTATVEGAADDSGPHIAEGAEAVLKLGLTNTAADGHFDGTAILVGYSVSQSQGDVGRITYTFQGSGTLAWSVSAY